MTARTRQQAAPPEAELDADVDRWVDDVAPEVLRRLREGVAASPDERLHGNLDASIDRLSTRRVDVPPLPTQELRDEYERCMGEVLDAPGQSTETASELVRAWSEYARAEKEAIDLDNASAEDFDLQGAIDSASSRLEQATRAARVPPRLYSSLRRLGQLHHASTLPEKEAAEYLAGKDAAYGLLMVSVRSRAGAKTARDAKKRGAATAARARAEFERLEKAKHPARDRAAKVAQRLGISVQHARKIRKARMS